MKLSHIWVFFMVLLCCAAIVGDRLYMDKLDDEFKELEKQRIITTNKLTTAKIVYENLNHVRDLVLKNIEFPYQTNQPPLETNLFEFITTCVNDLKLKLIAVKPITPITNQRVTTYSYELEIEGDFFKFGELCSKFENSRRIVSIESFSVDQLTSNEDKINADSKRPVRIAMRLNTYKIKGSAHSNQISVKPTKG